MTPSPSREAIVHGFRVAAEDADANALAALLAADVVALTDGGGDVLAATTAVRGPDAVAAEAIALLSRRAGVEVAEQSVNAAPALIARRGGRVAAIVSLGVRDGRVTQVWITRSPQKLQRWNRPG